MTSIDKDVQALLDAAAKGNVSAIWSLIDADSSLVWEKAGDLTALHVAAMAGEEEATALLITKRAGVNANGAAGTPLFQAALAGHQAVVECLLAYGADANLATMSGQTPLMAAACAGHLAIGRALIEAGAKLDMKTGSGANEFESDALLVNGESALHHAAARGAVDFVALLLESGARRDIEDNSGLAPRDWALRHQHEAVVRLLDSA